MGGFFGVTSRRDAIVDVFFGVDYHSHLGTRRGGMAAWGEDCGFQREIHNIENAPFRTKFEHITEEMRGTACIGCISDTNPQPLLIRSNLGVYAISTIGIIRNAEELITQFLNRSGGHFDAMSGGRVNVSEIIAAMIDQKSSFEAGIRFAQDVIDGTASILILKEGGHIIAARDKFGRLPVEIGRDADGYCVSFEPFAHQKLGYEDVRDLGPGEIVELTPEGVTILSPPRPELKICAFLWTYYGYPNSEYEGVNVEIMRNRNGAIIAENDRRAGFTQPIDTVSGVPDSGTAHAIGYANRSGIPFARPFIKYTPTWPRSFMPTSQEQRSRIAKMKMIPVHELIKGQRLLLVDDSIVRGTQLRETVDFLYEHGAAEVHMRSACPPIMYGCKYLNFSRNTSEDELIARSTIRELEGEEGDRHLDEYSDGATERGRALRRSICESLNFSSLEYQSLDGLIAAIGLPACDICTYCWNGRG